MFVEQLRRAVEASPRVELAKVSALLMEGLRRRARERGRGGGAVRSH